MAGDEGERDHRSEQVRLLDEPADWEVKSTALRTPAGNVTLIGDREIPGGAAGLVLFAHGEQERVLRRLFPNEREEEPEMPSGIIR